ncbi:MAG: hypothetical protein WBP12_02720 [Candidatus Saccharimonas sp.]
MHIDLNSCFATVEQQARPMLRGRPVAIVNRRTEHTMIVTASYEAKARGVGLGMKLKDAKRLCPELVGLESDPPKYMHVYHKLLAIMRQYSPHVTMKSIDEGVIDFSQATEAVRGRDLIEVGREIKRRLKEEIGCAMRCNVGIGTNRFLAKTAASLHKPDGLDELTSHNIREVFAGLELQDLTGIAARNEHRLNAVGIYTPLDILDADVATLRLAFKSVLGEWWYKRLRGWEVDDVDYDMKSCGRQYVLERRDLSRQEILQRLHHLVEDVGSKLRRQGKSARGVRVYARLYPSGSWHGRALCPLPFYSNDAIWKIARRLFADAPNRIRMVSVTCDYLQDGVSGQLPLFGDELVREQQVTWAIDEVNGRFGERVLHSADTLGTGIYMRTKIPFGSTRYL